MRIALIAPPFIPVPPRRYGGTELFLANLARGLSALGHEPVVYTNGESTVECEKRWYFPQSQWPITTELHSNLQELLHSSWAIRDAVRDCDLLHLNNAPALSMTRGIHQPIFYTLHHPHERPLSDYYAHFPRVRFVGISHAQIVHEMLPRLSVIHHGIEASEYQVADGKRDRLVFLGRMSPCKGAHIAVEVARRAGIPLRMAGEIQPLFRDYWETQVRPHVDGRLIEYVGEADLAGKNELFATARALLMPIEWEEPFGLVMLEAMACGVPVLAFPRGAAPEVVAEGVSGHLCASLTEMVERAQDVTIAPATVRHHVESRFTVAAMAAQYATLYQQSLETARAAERMIGGRTIDRTVDRAPERTLDRTMDRALERVGERIAERPARTPDRTPALVPGPAMALQTKRNLAVSSKLAGEPLRTSNRAASATSRPPRPALPEEGEEPISGDVAV